MVKKIALIVLFGAMFATGAPAATAYDALQVVKKAHGDGILKQLIEVRGETGQPQPETWTILMSDPTARGGVREFVVTAGAIASERTPVRGDEAAGSLPVINFSRLNLDSDGAFKVANIQANHTQVGFHTVDYSLRTNDADGGPLWVLHLFDYMGAPVGSLQISAENGKVVRALEIDPDAREKPVVQSGSPASGDSTEAEPKTHFPGGVFGFVERTSKKVATTVKKTSLHVAGDVQQVLTGERTVDQDGTSSGQ